MSSGESNRILWLDALKVCSILGVIGIHVSADSAGLPYAAHPAAERLAPTLLRAFVTAFNYPIFFIASFFLLAASDGAPGSRYSALARTRLRRLIPPFLIWSAVYLAFRNVKALAFGYHEYYLEELSLPVSWVKYLLIGNAQYHLHFLPTLMALTLLYPAYRLSLRWPIFGAVFIVSLLVWPQLDATLYAQWGYGHEQLPLALSASKVIGFAGYGFLGFALYGLHERGISRMAFLGLGVLAVAGGIASGVALVEEAFAAATAGQWPERDLRMHLAHYVAPASIAIAFSLTYRQRWSAVWARLSSLSFGVYLFHPMVLDSLEIVQRNWDMSPGVTVAFNFVAVTLLSFLVVSLASRAPLSRRAFGMPVGAKR